MSKDWAETDDGRVLSVTDFTRCVKELLESSIAPGWVRGEVSNLRAQSSGHVYFSLKDAGAQVSAVMFRGDAAKQSVQLRDGLQVVVFGQVSVYEVRGQYQLIVRAVIEDGVGRLQREFEALKKRLADEGLFAPERKIAVPMLPATIGFITSPTGAAVQDFIRILERRGWRGRLVVIPAKVQGTGAAQEMADMLGEAQALGIFDLLVIGRGGGSLEDLWAFNEEVLVRAVAACEVPIISAVGHEIDFTLCDFAADVRSETPSGAAELISSQFIDAQDRVMRAQDVLVSSLKNALAGAADRMEHARSRLRLLAPTAQIERGYLRLDDLENRLAAAAERSINQRRELTRALSAGLERRSPEWRVQLESQKLLALWKRLQSVSAESVLRRGYAIVRDASGQAVVRRGSIGSGQVLGLQFADGAVNVKAE